MNVDDLRAQQAPLKERYRVDPAAALSTMIVRGELDLTGSIVCRIETGHGPVVSAGMSPHTGGDGTAACSAEMLLEALCGCAGVTFGAVCTSMRLNVTTATVRVEGELDYRGTLGISRDVPVGFQSIRLTIETATTASDESLAKAAELTERYCVVARTLNVAVHAQVVRR